MESVPIPSIAVVVCNTGNMNLYQRMLDTYLPGVPRFHEDRGHRIGDMRSRPDFQESYDLVRAPGARVLCVVESTRDKHPVNTCLEAIRILSYYVRGEFESALVLDTETAHTKVARQRVAYEPVDWGNLYEFDPEGPEKVRSAAEQHLPQTRILSVTKDTLEPTLEEFFGRYRI